MKINYAEMILTLRVKLNISQQKLGNMLGVYFSTVNRCEKGVSWTYFTCKRATEEVI